MRIQVLYTLPLATALVLPAMAQQGPVDSQQPTASSESNSKPVADSAQDLQPTSAQNVNSDQNMSARQPLEPDYHQGLSGKAQSFSRGRSTCRTSSHRSAIALTSLDDLTAANAKDIKDVDARAQAGVEMADARRARLTSTPIDAGNRASRPTRLRSKPAVA